MGLQEASEGLLPAGVPRHDDQVDLGFWNPSSTAQSSQIQPRFAALQNGYRQATGVHLFTHWSFLFFRLQFTICHLWFLKLLMYSSSATPAPPPSPSPLAGGGAPAPPASMHQFRMATFGSLRTKDENIEHWQCRKANTKPTRTRPQNGRLT